jgi:hypothetical protein
MITLLGTVQDQLIANSRPMMQVSNNYLIPCSLLSSSTRMPLRLITSSRNVTAYTLHLLHHPHGLLKLTQRKPGRRHALYPGDAAQSSAHSSATYAPASHVTFACLLPLSLHHPPNLSCRRHSVSYRLHFPSLQYLALSLPCSYHI